MLHSLESKARNLKNLDFPRGEGRTKPSPLISFYEEVERWRESVCELPSEPIQRASEDGVCRDRCRHISKNAYEAIREGYINNKSENEKILLSCQDDIFN